MVPKGTLHKPDNLPTLWFQLQPIWFQLEPVHLRYTDEPIDRS
jgi:hypothetical protein